MGHSFRTELPLSPSDWQINHSTHVITMGSCFSDEVGGLLDKFRFPVIVNPYGTVYDPQSITRLLRYSIEGNLPDGKIVEYQGVYSHLDFHSSFNAISEEELKTSISEVVKLQSDKLKSADFLIVTLGTSWVYRHLESDSWVANCHKIPNDRFKKELLNPREVIKPLREVFSELKEINTGLKIMLTVSPVRHLKDGIPENQVSKSILRVACHYLQEDLPHVRYFPSYELVMDDLRDYRFYKEDMIHPNEQAVQYLWEAFSHSYFSNETIQLIKEVDGVLKSLTHKVFLPGTQKHLEFLSLLHHRLLKLNERLDFSAEIESVESEIQQYR